HLPDPSIWDTEENLVPIFGNDHFLWMLESILEENEIQCDSDEEADSEERFAKLLVESKNNTVEGVSLRKFGLIAVFDG
uniref:Uncharacterized protein n=1 Tax=Caenorhabditis japonica TaxID=281687 RepID=A0A8R1ENJ9_CAEJA